MMSLCTHNICSRSTVGNIIILPDFYYVICCELLSPLLLATSTKLYKHTYIDMATHTYSYIYIANNNETYVTKL